MEEVFKEEPKGEDDGARTTKEDGTVSNGRGDGGEDGG
jgi:hypothetical protein